jgi:hypothetical protein
MERFLDMIRTGIGNRRKADDPNYAGPERRKSKLQPPAGSQANAA